MFPIGDERIRGAKTPWVTISFILINVAVFVYELTLSLPALEAFYIRWGVVPAEIVAGNRWITLITAQFIHGGWLHLLGNLLFLWVFGDNIEVVLGHLGYLIFYLAGGAIASLAQVLVQPSSTIPSVGASGAIAAILGAYILMFPQSRVRVLLFLGFFITTTRVAALIFLGLWAIIQLFSGVASLGAPTAQTAGVAYWAHIGGFVTGILVGLLFKGRAERLRIDRRY